MSLNTLISSIYVFLISNNYGSMSPVMTSNKLIDVSKTFFLASKLFDAPVVVPIVQPTPQPIPEIKPQPTSQTPTQPTQTTTTIQPVAQQNNAYLSIITSYIKSQYNSKRITKAELQSIINSL